VKVLTFSVLQSGKAHVRRPHSCSKKVIAPHQSRFQSCGTWELNHAPGSSIVERLVTAMRAARGAVLFFLCVGRLSGREFLCVRQRARLALCGWSRSAARPAGHHTRDNATDAQLTTHAARGETRRAPPGTTVPAPPTHLFASVLWLPVRSPSSLGKRRWVAGVAARRRRRRARLPDRARCRT
jgi:hypothetical protein